MKKILPIIALFFAGIGSLAAQQNEEKGALSLGNDTPRSEIISYHSRELALEGNPAKSKYIQILDNGWKVLRYKNVDDLDLAKTQTGIDLSAWEKVTLPQKSSNSSQAAIYHTEFIYRTDSWLGRQVGIHVGPIGKSYYIYVNGKLIGYHEDSKTSAEFDITKMVVESHKNHLCIVAYGNPESQVLEEQNAGGVTHGGGVYIFSQPRVQIRDWIDNNQLSVDGTNGLLNIGVIIKTNLLNNREITLHYELIAPDGTTVESNKRDVNFDMKIEDTVRFSSTIANVESWSHQSPKQYTLLLRLQHEGRYTEYVAIKTAFTEVSFDAEGLKINRHPVEMRAVDYTPATDSATIVADLTRMRSKGINLLRVSNFPQQELFYKLTDTYGIYVCNQANIDSRLGSKSLAVGGTPANDTIWEGAYLERVMNMYLLSKNHPSVVMFSIGGKAEKGSNMYEAYLRLKAEQSTRPIVYQGAGREWNTDIVINSTEPRSPSDRRPAMAFGTESDFSAPKSTAVKLVSFSQDANKDSRVKITNNFDVVNLNNFAVKYYIMKGSRVICEGNLPSNIAPKEWASVDISKEGIKPGNYDLRVAVSQKEDSALWKKGDIVGEFLSKIAVPKAK